MHKKVLIMDLKFTLIVLSQMNHVTYEHKLFIGMYLDDIQDRFNGKGQR